MQAVQNDFLTRKIKYINLYIIYQFIYIYIYIYIYVSYIYNKRLNIKNLE